MNNYSSREERKSSRQTAILDVIARESLGTQNDLVKALRKRGVPATQVSVSRDIAELKLVKAGGRYQTGAADPEMPLRTWVRSASAAGPHLVVVRCDSGTAQSVGLVLDKWTVPGIVGTVAGDDTVFVAVDGAAASGRVLDLLRSKIKL